jgi:hypothetical protein
MPIIGPLSSFEHTRSQSLTFSFSNTVSWADERAFEYYISVFQEVIYDSILDRDGQPLHIGEWPQDRDRWATNTEEGKRKCCTKLSTFVWGHSELQVR